MFLYLSFQRKLDFNLLKNPAHSPPNKSERNAHIRLNKSLTTEKVAQGYTL